MSNHARVLVKKRTDDDGFYSSWQWNCSANHRCDQEVATTVWSQWHLNRESAYKTAALHARSCPALRLARLREQITAAAADIGRLRTIMYQRYGSPLTDVALAEAAAIITEHTGIEPPEAAS